MPEDCSISCSGFSIEQKRRLCEDDPRVEAFDEIALGMPQSAVLTETMVGNHEIGSHVVGEPHVPRIDEWILASHAVSKLLRLSPRWSSRRIGQE